MGRVDGIVRTTALAVLVAGLATFADAQDEGLDAMLHVPSAARGEDDVRATSFQIYRIPMAYPIWSVEDHPVGLRVTFPVSLSSARVEALGDVQPFITNLQAVAIIPGVELVVPLGERWQLKPFAEVGVGAGSANGDLEVLYGTGVRSTGSLPAGRLDLTVGAAAAYKKPATSRTEYDGYSRLEAGVDAQLPLGIKLGIRHAKGGVYGIVHRFYDLDLGRLGRRPILLGHQYEVGVSFSTEPALELWKVELPWIGVGYQFGDVFTGVRLYLAWPF